MNKALFALLLTCGLTCAAVAVPVNLAPSVLPAKSTAKPAPVAVTVAPAPVALSVFMPGGIAVCTTFPGTVCIGHDGRVYKTPVVQDAKGRQFASGPPVLLSQAPTQPLTVKQK